MATREDLEAAGRMIGQEFALDSESWAKWREENPDNKGEGGRKGGGFGGGGRRRRKKPVPAPIEIPAPAPPAKPPSTPAASKVDDVVGTMESSEREALDAGYAQEKKAGFTGTQSDYLKTQYQKYLTEEEGKSTATTWLSGKTMDKMKQAIESAPAEADPNPQLPTESDKAKAIADELRSWGLDPGNKPSPEMLKRLTPEERAKQEELQKAYDEEMATSIRPTDEPITIDQPSPAPVDQPIGQIDQPTGQMGKPFKRAVSRAKFNEERERMRGGNEDMV